MTNLRGFQQKLISDVAAAWERGAQAVMMQSATGSGKTVVMGSIATNHMRQPWHPRLTGGCSIAHRGELLGQMSMQLAREEVPHGIIASESVIKGVVAAHVEEFGRTFYNARSPWRVASINTIVRRDLGTWPDSVGMLHIDEGHHVLADNIWGRGAKLFKNARMLLPTATPVRADGRGLGRHAHGIADALVEGPPMRQLINEGYLTDYKIHAVPASDLKLDGVPIGNSGDFNPEALREAVHQSKAIVGDVVATYCEHARGKLGVTFAVDIEEARKIVEAFNAAGVPAALLTGDDDDAKRRSIIRKFERRELWQLVNVDLFGEGFDLPAIECVSFARPTQSFALYAQMFGRALRLMIAKVLAVAWDTYTVAQRKQFIAQSSKPFAYIFDHVGNFYRHLGPPDRPRVWTLDARTRRSKVDDGIPMRACLNPKCALPYERIFPACPYCGTEPPPPADRSAPEYVDGDITEIDPQLLARYRGEIARVDGEPFVPVNAPRLPVIAQHRKRQAAQHYLREAMAYWAGAYPVDDNRINYRRFYLTFHIDVPAACALGRPEADELRRRIVDDMLKRGAILPPNVTNIGEENDD